MPNTSEHPQNIKSTHGDKPELAYIKLARLGGFIGEQAKAKLMKDYYPFILQRCAHVLQNAADAQDAAQEVMLRMHKALPQFEGNSSLRTWISAIAHNECVNLIRHQQKNAATLQIDALIALFEARHDSLTNSADIPIEAVHEALNALSVHEREVLHLRFFGELPIAEMGSLLGLSVSATKMRLYRALEAFKRHYLEVQAVNNAFAA